MDETYGTYLDDGCFDIHDYDDDTDHDNDDDTDDDLREFYENERSTSSDRKEGNPQTRRSLSARRCARALCFLGFG